MHMNIKAVPLHITLTDSIKCMAKTVVAVAPVVRSLVYPKKLEHCSPSTETAGLFKNSNILIFPELADDTPIIVRWNSHNKVEAIYNVTEKRMVTFVRLENLQSALELKEFGKTLTWPIGIFIEVKLFSLLGNLFYFPWADLFFTIAPIAVALGLVGYTYYQMRKVLDYCVRLTAEREALSEKYGSYDFWFHVSY